MTFAVMGLSSIGFIVTSNFALYIHTRKEIVKIGRTLVGTESSARGQLVEMTGKAASTTRAVVVPFSVLNTPLYILMLVFYSNPDFVYSCLSVSLMTIFSTLLVVNSLCNPAIYAWKLTPVQAELRKMMPCLTRRPRPAPAFLSRATQSTTVRPKLSAAAALDTA
ncbi:hypothetical protein ElyMa_002175300 [Elysia marginata]|uniref:G-protein coupled receptors family 1 profile domain-containing protein n=1 Tax=Elysia marginata TaxID=1093978 RepID=A0AAV4FRF4_9GAST|nr:hypothetical protein ElyMa_002175300 [Elysia marginata]